MAGHNFWKSIGQQFGTGFKKGNSRGVCFMTDIFPQSGIVHSGINAKTGFKFFVELCRSRTFFIKYAHIIKESLKNGGAYVFVHGFGVRFMHFVNKLFGSFGVHIAGCRRIIQLPTACFGSDTVKLHQFPIPFGYFPVELVVFHPWCNSKSF
ncbi:hypothetical protein Runsl_4939 [Runella slithyformis DSM 19594]|uniref:Uncharacterized protein n=1 Tax=Runella slithyformis (strain ATCC 29530 / DSM 19594 / LMG 11500 / NCIMB 11436 / LSU 4) TaxID=761193 RepID=A0A7U4E8A9_RUNSL|nr:hypothetical protein Runsl_4939 [Runella slithyformis DSM 19594]